MDFAELTAPAPRPGKWGTQFTGRPSAGLRNWRGIPPVLTVLLLTLTLLFAGCATTNSDLRAVWNNMGEVKIGMTRQQVYGLVGSPQETEPQEDFMLETWEIRSETQDYCYMQGAFDSNSRLVSLEKRCSLPQ